MRVRHAGSSHHRPERLGGTDGPTHGGCRATGARSGAGGGCQSPGVILWGNSQHLFSVKIHRKAGTTGYHSSRGVGWREEVYIIKF